jgi:Leucine-rich repeat (LRR) protein
MASHSELVELDLTFSYTDFDHRQTIDSHLFSRFTKIKTLKLTSCQITEIDPHAFDFCSDLEHLDLSGNQLKIFTLKTVSPKHLSLEHNPQLETVKLLNERNESAVQHILVEKCHADLCVHILPGRESFVKWLSLDYTARHVLGQFSSLETLCIYGVKLQDLLPGLFKDMSSLKNLHLEYSNNGKFAYFSMTGDSSTGVRKFSEILAHYGE